MTARIDMVGKKYNRLTGIKHSHGSKWLFKCDCGNEKIINGSAVRTGGTLSCGCLQKERTSKASKTHGESKNSAHSSWSGMRGRCLNSKDSAYDDYGGRGITICPEWENSFGVFLKDMGDRPDGYSIERIDNNRGYSKDNCRWASRKEQQRNRRNNVLLIAYGVTLCMSEWAEVLEVPRERFYARYSRGWSDHDLLFCPSGTRGKNNKIDRNADTFEGVEE